MTDPTARIPDRADEDRVVSRRVDHPTEATERDAQSYRPTDPTPAPDTEQVGAGGTATEAEEEIDDDTGGPTRSE